MRRVLVVQHLEPEGPARVAEALADAGVGVDVVRVDMGQSLPVDLDGIAGLVVMGGPMSARSDRGFPTRAAELALLGRAVAEGVPVLGICLGAQLLATAAGGSVIAGDGPEIGWGPVMLSASAADDPLFEGLPEELVVLHWHGETYELPPDAVHLAGSTVYEQQAFRVGDRAWGLQFHLEVETENVVGFVEAFADDAAPGGGGESILAATDDAIRVLAPHRDLFLGRFAGVVAGAIAEGR